jgi:hypothetical protein
MSASTMPGRIIAPDDLIERDQWVLWLYETRGDSRTKVPQQTTGKCADSTDPRTWTSYKTALRCWQRFPKHYAGMGFVFHVDDPFCGVDLDNCLDEPGRVKPWAQGIVGKFSDTYIEISPSGRGIKLWCRGKLPANLGKVTAGDGGVEMYDHSRFFTVTGRVFGGAPLEVEDHAADLLTLYEWLSGYGRNKGGGWPVQPLDGGRIPHGQQHSTLVSIAGTLRARRVCDEAIEACLHVINERQCERPGPRENISHIVRSSRKWGAA